MGTLPILPQTGAQNFDPDARAVFDAWKASIEAKAEGNHTHGAGGVVIGIVANAAALGVGATDGESKITADTGHRWSWSVAAAAWTDQDLTTGTIVHHPVLHLQDQRALGVDGGDSVTGMNDRVLNTTLTNEITGASLLDGVVTAPAGLYWCMASGVLYGCNSAKTLIRSTADATLLSSENFQSPTGYDGFYHFPVCGRLILSVATDIKLSSVISFATPNIGLGAAGSLGTHETYAELILKKMDEGIV